MYFRRTIKTNTAGLVGWWPFDNGTAEDFSGNPAINGSLVLSPLLASGIAYSDNSLRRCGFLLNGSSQYINCTTDASLGLLASGTTYMCRIKATNFANAYTGICCRSQTFNQFFLLLVKSTGKLAVYYGSATNINYDGTGSNTLAAGVWYHLAITYENPAGTATVRGFVDGRLDGSASGVIPHNSLTDGGTTLFGNDTNFAGRFFAGIVDDARVYRRALSEEEIFAIAQEPYAPIEDDMPTLRSGLAQWQLYFSKNSGAYEPVTTTSIGVKSADASTDADETKILIPRL